MDPSKQPPRLPRDYGFRISLPPGTEVKYLIALEPLGFLEAYGADKTFHLKAPENIDPQRTRPDVPAVWSTADDAGYANEVVAQIFIQCADALSNIRLKRGDVNRLKVALHACKRETRTCERAFLRLREANNRIVAEINRTKGIRAEGNVINDFPQIPNLDDDVGTFLGCAKSALQHIAEVLNEFYGTTVLNARFDHGINQLEKLPQASPYILESLREHQPDVVRILAFRDGITHTPKRTSVQNFHMTAQHLQQPKWTVNGEEPGNLIPEMHKMIGTIIDLAEETFFIGLQDAIEQPAGPFQYAVTEVPPEARGGTKIRYRLVFQFAAQAESKLSEEGKPSGDGG